MSGKRQRRHFTGPEKMAILRRHLLDKVPVSQLCDEQGIHPTLFYGWQKTHFENGAAVFDGPRRNGRPDGTAAKRVETLTDKLRRKDEVLSELMEEYVTLKKSLGEA